jgi:hypothetical protein
MGHVYPELLIHFHLLFYAPAFFGPQKANILAEVFSVCGGPHRVYILYDLF